MSTDRHQALLAELIRCSERVRQAIIQAERRQLVEIVGLGADGAETSGIDQVAELAALQVLESIEPRCNILSEEVGLLDRGSALTLIVDPIDATTNAIAAAELTLQPPSPHLHEFLAPLPAHSGQYGFPYYAFSVGAVFDGRLVAACVRNLPTGDLFTAVAGAGSRMNGTPIRCEPVTRLTDAWVALVRAADQQAMHRLAPLMLGAGRIRITGCTALDLCLVAAGVLHAFVNPNIHRPTGFGEKVVDYAGPWLVLQEAGGIASGPDGQPLPLDLDLLTLTPPIAAATSELHRELLAMLG